MNVEELICFLSRFNAEDRIVINGLKVRDVVGSSDNGTLKISAEEDTSVDFTEEEQNKKDEILEKTRGAIRREMAIRRIDVAVKYHHGVSMRSLINEYEASTAQIQYWHKKFYGRSKNTTTNTRKISDEEFKKVLEMRKQGVSISDIARCYGVFEATLIKNIKERT